ncbi:hypothetical protein D3C83_60430 [compost metagenome]
MRGGDGGQRAPAVRHPYHRHAKRLEVVGRAPLLGDERHRAGRDRSCGERVPVAALASHAHEEVARFHCTRVEADGTHGGQLARSDARLGGQARAPIAPRRGPGGRAGSV